MIDSNDYGNSAFPGDHEFDLPEEVCVPRAVGVAQDQLARGAYAFEDGLDERAVGAAVRVCFAQPVHALPVLFLQGRLFAPYELVVAAHAAGMEGFEHLAAVERAAAGDRHRHGVG